MNPHFPPASSRAVSSARASATAEALATAGRRAAKVDPMIALRAE